MTKAKMLEFLQTRITKSKILPLFYVKKRDINILRDIPLEGEEFVVRSSSKKEDKKGLSNAGRYTSLLGVKRKELFKAIKVVSKELEDDDEILIQPFLKDVEFAGVIFTADVETGAPYYIIEFDTSGVTDKVTSGKTRVNKYIRFKNYKEGTYFNNLIEAVKEIEHILKEEYLDIEFGIKNNEVYIFQVRYLNVKEIQKIELEPILQNISKEIKSVYGIMPDWNPAEIIGVKPKKLSLSLYQELVTDEIFAKSRRECGYKGSYLPLIYSFYGLPYVDLRVSFFSFLPKNIDKKKSEHMVKFYIDKLLNNPSFHDKIEFEVVFSSFYFGIEKELKDTYFIEELKKITKYIMSEEFFQLNKKRIEELEKLLGDVKSYSPLERIVFLLTLIKDKGTLSFANFARAAFVAVKFIDSMQKEGLITAKDKERFFISLNTVSKQMIVDYKLLSKTEFAEKYGHLRPGTYDITSNKYGDKINYCIKEVLQENYEFDIELKELDISKRDFNKFLRNAIEYREYSKFIFTKGVNEILEAIEEFGKEFGLSKEELAFSDINIYKDFFKNGVFIDKLLANIKFNKEVFKYTQIIKLPYIITSQKDVFEFFIENGKGNFITSKIVEGEISTNLENISDKIVCIESADPGYDFIFSYNIKGLITKYGGANSHMAIRCAELDIPALIGCGELYDKIIQRGYVKLDCLHQKVSF